MKSLAELSALQQKRHRRRTLVKAAAGMLLAVAVMGIIACAVTYMDNLGTIGIVITSTLVVLLGGGALYFIERQLARCPRCCSTMDMAGNGKGLPVVWIVAPHYLASPSCPHCGYPETKFEQPPPGGSRFGPRPRA